MTAFDRLHPAVQHHIVNSLGWKSLRPLQEAAIEPVLAGHHALLLAPTAGGKTEAAILPIFSRMLSEDWRGLGVVYVCPIKALINNLAERLAAYAALFGRRVGVWHGDIPQAERARIVREPPDLLLATPESLEVVLVSRRIAHRELFRSLRVVIVDEIHAFAGDDRGWHLIALLDRLGRLSEQVPQRLGLSATVGNARELLGWLVAGSPGERQVVAPVAGLAADADVLVDSVGTIENAAVVISRLHRGEKRLVFCDSRSQVETLATELRTLGVHTFVSHSSLSVDARRQAEQAFASGENCVIVATSTLELGIDVGDLDRIIQIDAPHSVASFLQRLGRTGRRSGTRRNCLFLAIGDEAFLRVLAILRLWAGGYVEPVRPPPLPYQVVAQQVLALALQEGGVGRYDWRDWLAGFRRATGIGDADAEALVAHMLGEELLFEVDGLLSVGAGGEAKYGLRNYLELFSVFNSPPLYTVLHGRTEIGQVHPLTFQAHGQGPLLISLAGRGWVVKFVDWTRQQAFVEPSDAKGRSRWLGGGQGMHFDLCQAVQAVLTDETAPRWLSVRAQAKLEELRESLAWVRPGSTTVVHDDEESCWWTFGGARLNAILAANLGADLSAEDSDDFAVRLTRRAEPAIVHERAAELAKRSLADFHLRYAEEALEAQKFMDCVPLGLRRRVLEERLLSRREIDWAAGVPIVDVRVATE